MHYILKTAPLSTTVTAATSLGPVCDQDSIMEFGFNQRCACLYVLQQSFYLANAADVQSVCGS